MGSIILLFIAGAVGADTEPSKFTETVVVTGDYMPTMQEAFSNPVYVIDRAELETLQKASVVDVLRTVPGVLVNQPGGVGGVTQVSIRGSEPNFTVVMIDGVQVNDSTNARGGSYDFSNLNIRSIERIEVIRGTQSAVYGSDALAGVINIITISPTEHIENSINAGFGEYGYFQAGYQLRGRSGELGYALNLQRLDSGEQVEGSEYKGSEATARLQFRGASGTDINASLRYVDGSRTSFPEQSGGPIFAVSRDLDEDDSKDISARLNIGHEFAQRWSSELDLSWFQRDDEQSSPGIAPFTEVPPNSSDSHYQRAKLMWVNRIKLSPQFDFTAGLDGRFEKGDSEGALDFFGNLLPTDYKLKRNTYGGFIDLSYRAATGLVVQGSARLDDPEDFDREVTGRLGIKVPVANSGTKLFANWGRGYKLPSFFALGHGLVGNPDLQPESAESWDVGIEWQNQPSRLLRLTVFYNDYKDLIDFDEQTFSNVNRDQVVTKGAEFEGQWRPFDPLDLKIHATYTDIDVVDTDRDLAGRPRWAAGATVNWRFLPDWSLGVDFEWSDEVYDASRYSGEAVQQTLDSWQTLDANLRWQPFNGLNLALIISNVFDTDYQQAVGFPSPGRWLRVEGRYSF